MKTHYQWCVIGAGPAGITAINKLIVNNVNPHEIVWISNHFDCGDLGKKWIFVPANSNIASIRKYLHSCLNFNYNKLPASSKIRQLHEENFCHIIDIVEALQPIIKNLQNKVTTLQSIVLGISEKDKYYLIKHRTNYKKEIYSKKIIIATGAIPLTQKSNKTRINLEIALNPKNS